MANIVIGARPLVAHVRQTFGLASDLRRRGHRITYVLATTQMKDEIEARGFDFYHFVLLKNPPKIGQPTFLGKLLPEVARLQRIRREAREVYEALVDPSAYQSVITALAPDLLVADSTAIKYALPFLAWKVPLVLVSPTLPNEWDDNVPHTHSHYTPKSSRFNRYRCQWEWIRIRAVRHILVKMGFSEYSDCGRVAEHYGLPYSSLILTPPFAVRIKQTQLILCPYAFDFPRARLGNNRFVDFGLDDHDVGAEGTHLPLAVVPGLPIVYCCFGTRVPEEPAFKDTVRKIILAIIKDFARQNEFQLVIRIHGLDRLACGNLPENILLVDEWIPQLKMLQHTAVHITHGGFASVRESIHCGVPMILVPFDADQPGNAARAVFHNLGIRVFPAAAAHTSFLELTRTIHSSSRYQEGVKWMKAKFDQQRQTQTAADVIESLLPSASLDLAYSQKNSQAQ